MDFFWPNEFPFGLADLDTAPKTTIAQTVLEPTGRSYIVRLTDGSNQRRLLTETSNLESAGALIFSDQRILFGMVEAIDDETLAITLKADRRILRVDRATAIPVTVDVLPMI